MKQLVVRGYVPIRKENRWDAIQHYATTPNTGMAVVPRRQQDLSSEQLFMPERQESVCSHTTHHSTQTRKPRSTATLTSSSTGQSEDQSDGSALSPKKRNSPLRPNMLNKQGSNPSFLSSSSSDHMQPSSKSLLSSKSLATTYEEEKKEDDTGYNYRGYTTSLSDFVSNPLVPRFREPMALEDWFEHSDNSSATTSNPSISEDEAPATKPNSGRSMIPVIHECQEESTKEDDTGYKYRGYSTSLSDFVSNPLVPRSREPMALEDWFEHSDNSSATKSNPIISEDETPATKPNSGRSMIPVIHECQESTHSCSTAESFAASDFESGTISELSGASPESDEIENTASVRSGSNSVTEASIKKVLRECAPHSSTSSCDGSTVSSAGSTKLDRLREKMKKLREKNHQQIMKSRAGLERNRSSSQSNNASLKAILETTEHSQAHNPSLHRTDEFSQSTKTSNSTRKMIEQSQFRNPSLHRTDEFSLSTNSSSKTLKNVEQIRNANPSLHRTDEFSQSTKSTNKSLKKIEQIQNENPSLHWTDEFSQSTKSSKKTPKNQKQPSSDWWQLEEQTASPELNSSWLESQEIEPKNANATPKKTEEQTSSFDWWNLGEESTPPEPQSTSLESHASSGRPEKIEEPKSANASWKRQSHSRSNMETCQRRASSSTKPKNVVSKRLMKDLRKDFTLDETPSVPSRSRSRSVTPQASFESEFASIAQEATESFKAEVNSYEPNIQIGKQCSTPKTPKDNIQSSPVKNETLKQTRRRKLLEKLAKDKKKAQLPTTPSLGTPSFDSSKSSSYAEEAVASLQAERRQNPKIHITRSYSMKQLAQEEKDDSPIEKPKRAGRRPVPSRSFSGKEKPESLVHELKDALSARGPPVSAEQERHCAWFDASQSDGTAPLASEVPLSLPATPPTSFKARRDAYLNKIGDCDEKRRQNPFTTANWVLGHLPEVPESSPSQGAEEREEEEETLVSWHEIGTQSPGRVKKWTTRENVEMNMEKDVENAGDVSSGRVIRKWMARENVRKNAAARKESRCPRHDPLHESRQTDRSKSIWAQRSFVNRFAPASTQNEDHDETVVTPSGSRLVRSKSSNEKGNARKTSLGRLVRSSSKSSVDRERDEPCRQPVRSDSKLSARSDTSQKPSLRRHLGRKYSGNREKNDSSRKPSSRRVTRNSSKSSRTLSLMSAATKSSIDPEQESLLDSGYESSDNNDTVSLSRKTPSSWRAKTMTKTVKRPSSGRFGKQSVAGTSTPKKPSSSRFGKIVDKLSKDRDSYALLECKSSLDQESHCTEQQQQPLSSGRFGESKSNKKKHENVTSRDPSSRRLKDIADDKRDKPVSRRISSSSSSSKKNQEKHDSWSTLEDVDKRDDSTNSMKNSRTKQPSSRRVGTTRRDSGKSSRRRDQNGNKTRKTESINSHRNEASKHDNIEIDNITSKKPKDAKTDDCGAIPKYSRRTRFRKTTFERLARYKNYRTNGISGSDTKLKRFDHIDVTGSKE